MVLADLNVNQSAKIVKLPSDTAFSLRLCEMGIGVGSDIKCVVKPIFKSPILYSIKDSLIAIRLCDSKKIEVEI